MNDKDRELLAQILHAGGAAAEKGFSELVRWCFVDALANVICYAVVVAIIVIWAVKILRWNVDETNDPEIRHILRVIGLIVCAIALTITTGSWLPGNLRELVAPQGEAVAYVLGHH
jgi:hypothetical protein